MPLRMPARLLASVGAVALAASLSSCGFDYATDRVYDVAAGTTNRDAAVDVLSAVIVSAQQGSGTLITSFSNNDHAKSAKVTDIAPGAQSSVQVEGFSPITVPAGGLVNLAEAGTPVVVKASNLQSGDFETLKFTFGDGSSENLDIPVVWACNEWQGLDSSGSSSSSSSPSSSGSSGSSSSPSGAGKHSSKASPSSSASSSASSSSAASPSPSETSEPPAASPSSPSSASSASSTECAVPSSSAFPETGTSE